jgi:putative ABC transport system permease protein
MLALEIDPSVLVGFPFARQYLGFEGHRSTIYIMAADSQANSVDNLLAARADPEKT